MESGTSERCTGGSLKLGEEFSHLKAGFRGDLRFYENPNVYEIAELLQEQTPAMQMDM